MSGQFPFAFLGCPLAQVNSTVAGDAKIGAIGMNGDRKEDVRMPQAIVSDAKNTAQISRMRFDGLMCELEFGCNFTVT